jgi:hypothetical protein
MKKMNKMYEAPVAEIFEMQMPVTLLNTSTGDEFTASGVPDPTDPDNE